MTTKKINPALLKMAMDSINQLPGQDKSAFVPPPDPVAAGGMPMDPAMAGAPMDPMAAGGMPPVDPAMMAGGAMPPMDPAMLEQVLPPEAPVPADTGGADDLKSQIKEVLEETGVIKAPKQKPEEMVAQLESKLDAILSHLGIQAVETPQPEEAAPEGTMSSGTSGASSELNLSGAAEEKTASETASNRIRNAINRLNS